MFSLQEVKEINQNLEKKVSFKLALYTFGQVYLQSIESFPWFCLIVFILGIFQRKDCL